MAVALYLTVPFKTEKVRSGLKIHKAVLWYKVCKYRQQ